MFFFLLTGIFYGAKFPELDCTESNDFNSLYEGLINRIQEAYYTASVNTINRNFLSFIEFHKNRSNDFYFTCETSERGYPMKDYLCIYGMAVSFYVVYETIQTTSELPKDEPERKQL